MPATYEPIATTTLSSAAASITFSSISSAYTDLKLVFVGIGTGNLNADIRFNNDTNTNYSNTIIYGTGATAASSNGTSKTSIDLSIDGINATQPHFYEIDIFSYAGSTYKTMLNKASEDNNGSGFSANLVGLWRSTSAINRIDLIVSANNFASGTTATLYGIKSA